MKIINLTNPNQEPVTGDFVQYEYPDGTIIKKNYYKPIDRNEEYYTQAKLIEERQWRDAELALTDFIVPLTDHPKHAEYMTYRQELRDYPSQPDFPNGTRPVKP